MLIRQRGTNGETGSVQDVRLVQPESAPTQHPPPTLDRPEDPAFSFADIEPIAGFDALADPQVYTSLPDDWVVGLADVVDSTAAIEAGRYKAVNTAGAAVISAVTNALGRVDFPFSFGGDGATFAVPRATPMRHEPPSPPPSPGWVASWA